MYHIGTDLGRNHEWHIKNWENEGEKRMGKRGGECKFTHLETRESNMEEGSCIFTNICD